MRVSVNELETLAKKAAVGAGIHYGYASEAAQSLVWLSATGIDAIPGYVHTLRAWSSGKTNPVAVWCTAHASTIKASKGTRASVLYAAPAARDFLQVITRTARPGGITIDNVDHPSFVLAELAREPTMAPTLIRCTEPTQSDVRWIARLPGEQDPDLIHIDGDLRNPNPADVLVTPASPSDANQPQTTITTDTRSLFCRGVDIDPTHYEVLRTFLNLTLVPDSEESRRHGDGAGLVDSD